MVTETCGFCARCSLGDPPALAQHGTQLLGAIIISGAEGGGEGSGAQAETLRRGCWGVKQKNHTEGPWDPQQCLPPNLAPTLPGEPWLPQLPAAPAMKMKPLGRWPLLCLLGGQSDTACRAGTGRQAVAGPPGSGQAQKVDSGMGGCSSRAPQGPVSRPGGGDRSLRRSLTCPSKKVRCRRLWETKSQLPQWGPGFRSVPM